MTEPIPVPTSDLLRHVGVRVRVHSSDTVWVRSISGTPETGIVSVGFGVVEFFGELDVVRERLAATLAVVDAAIGAPERWPQIRAPGVSNPFVDYGTGASTPRWVGPMMGDGPDPVADGDEEGSGL